MNSFIKTFFTELCHRLEKMTALLYPKTMETYAASKFKDKAIFKLRNLQERVKHWKDSGILEDDFFTPNARILYNSLTDEFLEKELLLFLPLYKYADRVEGYFEKLIRAIYAEIGYNQTIPFVSAISNSEAYYWAYSSYDMIAVPQGEEEHLLNLADLYHEIGHFIFLQYSHFLINTHLDKIGKYFDSLESKTLRLASGISKNSDREEAQEFWENNWSEEIACDLIATYLVGPAYAYSHMKICIGGGCLNSIYTYTKNFNAHPPNEVRMRAIISMLELTGFKDEASELKKYWQQFIIHSRNKKPWIYDLIFPEVLVTSIVKNVFEGCKKSNLQPYSEQLKNNTMPVSWIINEAWQKISAEPEKYPQWEAGMIATVRSFN